MGIITKMLNYQTAVYWALASDESAGSDYDNFGKPNFTDPIEIKVRWEDNMVEFIAADGTQQMSTAVVYVDRDVDLGGVLMLGDLDDVTDEDNPKENENAWEIRRFDKMPKLKQTEILRTVYL